MFINLIIKGWIENRNTQQHELYYFRTYYICNHVPFFIGIDRLSAVILLCYEGLTPLLDTVDSAGVQTRK